MDAEKQDQNIIVQISQDYKDADVGLHELKQLVKTICNRFKLHKATVSIAIVNDTQICKLNKQFLNRNCPTDCLSFDLSDEKKGESGSIDANSEKSFELVVNGEMAAKEASLRGHSSEAELALYITHGLLHNLGFDDSSQEQAQKMHDAEDEILQQLGYGSVYNKDLNTSQNGHH